jgi:hypothetical protein
VLAHSASRSAPPPQPGRAHRRTEDVPANLLQFSLMMFQSRIEPANVVGCAPDRLKLEEAIALAGQFVALEIYSPERTPLKRIEAIGETPEDCIGGLAARGLDPRKYEIVRLKPPF